MSIAFAGRSEYLAVADMNIVVFGAIGKVVENIAIAAQMISRAGVNEPGTITGQWWVSGRKEEFIGRSDIGMVGIWWTVDHRFFDNALVALFGSVVSLLAVGAADGGALGRRSLGEKYRVVLGGRRGLFVSATLVVEETSDHIVVGKFVAQGL